MLFRSMVVLAAKDHPLFQESNISIARLAEEPLISREIGSGIRDTTMKRFSEHGLTPNIRMDLGSNEAIKHAVIGGLGVAILSLHTLVLDGADGPLGVLDVEGFPIERKWYLAHPQDKELSPMVKAFLDFARASEPVISERMRTLYAQFSARHKDNVCKKQI